jgi:hypothetical protein
MTELARTVHEVFKTQGQPTVTYVSRENGEFERKLSNALDSRGLICLLTGPSKTGKTTLYSKVLQTKRLQPLQVRCHTGLSATDFWRSALEKVNFERIAQQREQGDRTVSGTGELSGSIGWKWLAGLSGTVTKGVTSTTTEVEVRQRILATPSPDHLVPILKNLPLVLVIEDFHYLQASVQANVFQQWKVFIDNEVSVLVVGTTHHAADLAYANKDLVGRVSQIDLTTWDKSDLAMIATGGFNHMRVRVPRPLIDLIAEESVGLPIMTQSVCLQLLLNDGLDSVLPEDLRVDWTTATVYEALHQVARDKYEGFGAIYDRLARGPRRKARKYETYELVLSAFTLDPLVFSLKSEEIADRLARLPILPQQIPPQGSFTSMFRALGAFQKKLGIELLEWIARDRRLYILEPAFLYYIRWRTPRTAQPSLPDLLAEILRTFQQFKMPVRRGHPPVANQTSKRQH